MDQEGIIKYRQIHVPGPSPDDSCVACLSPWREHLFSRGWIGQDPARYGGLGYGNVSVRHPVTGFVITATATGHLSRLPPSGYVHVTAWNIGEFVLHSAGPSNPSSEAFTHAVLYEAIPAIAAVVHVHCPRIWAHRAELGIPETPPEVDYGSAAMAASVRTLADRLSGGEGMLFAMAGHRDGLLSAGVSLASCVQRLEAMLARAGTA